MTAEFEPVVGNDQFLEFQDGKVAVGFSDGVFIFDPVNLDWTALVENGRTAHISSFPKYPSVSSILGPNT